MCPYTKMKRTKNRMPFELFKKIVDYIIANELPVRTISLTGMGEPLLDPTIFKKIEYVKKNTKIKINFATNASLLTKEKIDNLIKSGVDWINISYNGGTKQTYEEIMGINFEKVNKNIMKLIKRKRELNSEKPYITMSCVLLRENASEMNEIKKRWERYFPVAFNFASNWGGCVEVHDVNKKYRNKKWPCWQLWTKFLIAWDGTVTGCCPDMVEYTLNLGSVKSQGLLEIWNSPKWKKLRRLHLSREWDKIPLCKNCNVLYEASVRWWRV